MTFRRTQARLIAVVIAATVVLLVPSIAAAHAELEASTPADGATIVGAPAGDLINAKYSEKLDPSGSSLTLVDANGATIAKGGVAPSGDYPFEMWIEDLPELKTGTYTVRSTSKSAEDGDIDRKTWSFRIVAPTGSPTPVPQAICTDQCDPGNSIATAAPPPSPTPGPSLAPAPSASAAPTGGTAAGGSDVILPIVAALAIILIGAAALLSRRGRPSGRG
jgi:methionine-rich copper-binding protein CopC